jgi:hypothetical protein
MDTLRPPHPNAGRHVFRASALAALFAAAACGGTSVPPTPTPLVERSVPELADILADPVAATDCELKAGAELLCRLAARDAAEALGEKGDPAAVPALMAAVEDPDTASEVGAASWSALEKIGGPEVIAYLVASITDSTSAMRSDLAAGMLGELGNVEHNQILVEALYGTSACQTNGATDALVAINRADATPLLKYLESYDTVSVYGPLIRIGQAGTEDALLAVFEEWADKGMAQCFLNSGNPRLEQAAEDWVAVRGYWTLRIEGGAVSWGGG